MANGIYQRVELKKEMIIDAVREVREETGVSDLMSPNPLAKHCIFLSAMGNIASKKPSGIKWFLSVPMF